MHDPPPWTDAHTWPQAPQLAASIARLTSHPLTGMRSQSAKPIEQGPGWHMPMLHTAAAFGYEQAFWHMPQCIGSVLRLTSQPSEGSRLQSAKPISHTPMAHLPVSQAGVPFAIWQTVPHPPQC